MKGEEGWRTVAEAGSLPLCQLLVDVMEESPAEQMLGRGTRRGGVQAGLVAGVAARHTRWRVILMAARHTHGRVRAV